MHITTTPQKCTVTNDKPELLLHRVSDIMSEFGKTELLILIHQRGGQKAMGYYNLLLNIVSVRQLMNFKIK